MAIDAFPFVEISGTPFGRGEQYGAQAADRVRLTAAFYAAQLADLGYDAVGRSQLIGGFVGLIEEYGAAYIEEMKGIARGADIPFEDVVMINARTEVIAKARMEQDGIQLPDPLEDGCTAVAVLPERSVSGAVLHGQNWDWKAECAATGVVLRVRRDDGPDILTFVEAGGLARSGLNAAGISITGNDLKCERDYTQTGVPLCLIRRKALEQEHFALAIRAVASTDKTCSNNMMLATGEGFAIDFECAPDESFPLYPSDGLIVHANHWIGATAQAKLRDTGIRPNPDSLYRDWRVRHLLDAAGRMLDTNDVKNALFDDFLAPHAVCRPPHPNDLGQEIATVAMVVMQPWAGIMEVAPLPAFNRTFTRYSLSDQPRTNTASRVREPSAWQRRSNRAAEEHA